MSKYPYNSIREVIEAFMPYNFNEELVKSVVQECGQFLLGKKGYNPQIIKHLSMEFVISTDNTYVGVFGNNLMSTLWIIDVFPPEPQKYISETMCIFQDKKYIYDPSKKTVKISKWRTKKS